LGIRSFHPLLLLGLWLLAAFLIINAGPAFVPSAGSTVRFAGLIWKVIGASLFLVASLLAFGGPAAMTEKLGLTFGIRTLQWLAIGSIGGGLFVCVWFLLLRGLTAFHLERGTMSAAGLSISALIYFFGALLEELAFRGYPFLRLRNRYGSSAAVAATSVAFGVLHLPGMSGIDAFKIIIITGLSSVLFCIAFLNSRTLWTAVGLHMGMNIALHSALGGAGAAGPSLARVIFDGPRPDYDVGFWSFILTALFGIAGMIWLTIPLRRVAQAA
jgi:membrane protease YdiL (CAAX protease family)